MIQADHRPQPNQRRVSLLLEEWISSRHTRQSISICDSDLPLTCNKSCWLQSIHSIIKSTSMSRYDLSSQKFDIFRIKFHSGLTLISHAIFIADNRCRHRVMRDFYFANLRIVSVSIIELSIKIHRKIHDRFNGRGRRIYVMRVRVRFIDNSLDCEWISCKTTKIMKKYFGFHQHRTHVILSPSFSLAMSDNSISFRCRTTAKKQLQK